MTPPATAILVAEDDAQHALLIRAAFAAAHFANPVVVVDDGDQAVAYLKGEGAYADRERHPRPVLVLLDLHMPGRSGLEVLAWLRAQPNLRQLPVIVLTASEEEANIKHAFDAGAMSYLIKPVGFDALLDVVRSLELQWLIIEGSQASEP